MKAAKTRKRLKRARKILSQVPKKNFTRGLARWIAVPSKALGEDYPVNMPDGEVPTPTCKTLACGMGWLALHPTFLRKKFDIAMFDGEFSFKLKGDEDWSSMDAFNAAEAFFGLSNSIVYQLFGPEEVGRGSEKSALMERFDTLLRMKNRNLQYGDF